MRRYIHFFVLAIVAIFSAGCSKMDDSGVLVSSLAEKIKAETNMAVVEKEIDNVSASERYGISPNAIAEGIVLVPEQNTSADEIIILKAIDSDHVQDIERSMQAEIERLSSAWEETDINEYKKIRNSVVKTRGEFILLAVSENAKQIENIFDREV